MRPAHFFYNSFRVLAPFLSASCQLFCVPVTSVRPLSHPVAPLRVALEVSDGDLPGSWWTPAACLMVLGL